MLGVVKIQLKYTYVQCTMFRLSHSELKSTTRIHICTVYSVQTVTLMVERVQLEYTYVHTVYNVQIVTLGVERVQLEYTYV